jgi:regulatory protein
MSFGRRRERPDRPARPEPDAHTRALGLLSRREHSRRELKRKLGAHGSEPVAIDQALDRLGEQGLQSDPRFAELLVRSRIGQGHGPVRILAELRQHGIDEAQARAAIDQEQPDWPALAEDVCRRRFRAPAQDRAEQARRMQFLLRRGFPPALARTAVGACDADPDGDATD